MSKIFIALTTDTETARRLGELQKQAELYLEHRYGYKNSLWIGSAPHHITLVAPFEESLLGDKTIPREFPVEMSFSVPLPGISTFMPSTVYAKVEDSSGMIKKLRDFLHEQFDLATIEHTPKHYVPHVSLARHFQEDRLHAIRESLEYAAVKHLPAEFPVLSVTTYRDEGGQWKRYKRQMFA